MGRVRVSMNMEAWCALCGSPKDFLNGIINHRFSCLMKGLSSSLGNTIKGKPYTIFGIRTAWMSCRMIPSGGRDCVVYVAKRAIC